MKERPKEWLSFAEEDLRVAELALKESIYNQVCFHSQQAVEKSLKALIEKKTKVPKEHRLLNLTVLSFLPLLTACRGKLSRNPEEVRFPLTDCGNDREEIPTIKLLKICQELGYDLERFRSDLEFIDKFYTVTRYPFIIGMLPEGYPSKEDASKSTEIAETILSFVGEIL